MKHIQLFEDFFSDKTKSIQKQIEDGQKQMDDLKKQAAKDPFHDSHTDLKKQFKDKEKEVSRLGVQFQKSVDKDLSSIGKKPFKYKTKEEQTQSMELIFYALGYTDKDLKPGFPYDDAKFDPRGLTYNKEYEMCITVPKDYTTIIIKLDKDGNMYTKMGPERWGSIPDDGSWWMYGTSGHNNPAPTSRWPDEKRKVKTIGDVVSFLNDLRAKVQKTHAAKAKAFSDYLAAGGSPD